MAEGKAWVLGVYGLFAVEVVNIEPGDEVVIGVAAAGSIVDAVDVVYIEGDGDAVGVVNIAAVGADGADGAGVVDVVAVGMVDAFAEVQLDELVLELRQSPEKVLVALVYPQSAQLENS